MTKLSKESFIPLFGTWWPRIEKFFDAGGFDKIYERLKSDSKRGVLTAPLSSNVFRCFSETPIDEVKVVMCGLSPYHTFYNNLPIADGILMSCSITKKLQPSLLKFYEELERTMNNGEECSRNPDLRYLCKEGVLMLNSSLTTSYMKAGNHCEMWEPFMKYLFEEVLNTNGIPMIFLGKESAKLKRYVFPFTWIFELTHPAYASYQNIDWFSDDVFNKINKILHDNNKNSIQWMKTN